MSLQRRLFGSAMMGEALRERREILLESFDILRKEITMGTPQTYYNLTGTWLYQQQGDNQHCFRVSADELRRVLNAETVRRAFESLERRLDHPPRRSGAAERRTSDFRQLWSHWCVKDYNKSHVLRSPFCPECGISRTERRSTHRRNPFSTGRRKEDV